MLLTIFVPQVFAEAPEGNWEGGGCWVCWLFWESPSHFCCNSWYSLSQKKSGQECVAFWRFHKLNSVRQIVIDAGCTWQFSCGQQLVHYERFESRGRFLSRWSMIIWLNMVLNRTVVDGGWRFDNLSVIVFWVKGSCITFDGRKPFLYAELAFDYLFIPPHHKKSSWQWHLHHKKSILKYDLVRAYSHSMKLWIPDILNLSLLYLAYKTT